MLGRWRCVVRGGEKRDAGRGEDEVVVMLREVMQAERRDEDDEYREEARVAAIRDMMGGRKGEKRARCEKEVVLLLLLLLLRLRLRLLLLGCATG